MMTTNVSASFSRTAVLIDHTTSFVVWSLRL